MSKLVSLEKRYEYWNHFMSQWVLMELAPDGIGRTKLRKVYEPIMKDDEFWDDVVGDTEARRVTPEHLWAKDYECYRACRTAFWAGIHLILHQYETDGPRDDEESQGA